MRSEFGPQQFTSYAWTYEDDSSRAAQFDQLDHAAGVTRRSQYEYDGLGQLVNVLDSQLGEQSYEYTVNGNPGDGVSTILGANNELLRYDVVAHGEAVAGLTFEYDGDSNRVQKGESQLQLIANDASPGDPVGHTEFHPTAGSWSRVDEPAAYSQEYHLSADPGAKATWRFRDRVPGEYVLYATWPALGMGNGPNSLPGASQVRYQVSAGDAQVNYDQAGHLSGPREDLIDAGAAWERIGQLRLDERGDIQIELSRLDESQARMAADAIRLERKDATLEVYEWDHRGRLAEIASYEQDSGEKTLRQRVRYGYDALNRRVLKEVDQTSPFDFGNADVTLYAYDGSDLKLTLRDDAAIQTTSVLLAGPGSDHNLAEDVRIHVKESGDVNHSVLWPIVDRQGTVRQLAVHSADAPQHTSPQLHEHYQYDAYGRITAPSSLELQKSLHGYLHAFAYTGRELDLESGLQQHRARYYDANARRWISEDPLGFAAGDANLNRYAFNDPVSYSDPSGTSVSQWLRSASNGASELSTLIGERGSSLLLDALRFNGLSNQVSIAGAVESGLSSLVGSSRPRTSSLIRTLPEMLKADAMLVDMLVGGTAVAALGQFSYATDLAATLGESPSWSSAIRTASRKQAAFAMGSLSEFAPLRAPSDVRALSELTLGAGVELVSGGPISDARLRPYLDAAENVLPTGAKQVRALRGYLSESAINLDVNAAADGRSSIASANLVLDAAATLLAPEHALGKAAIQGARRTLTGLGKQLGGRSGRIVRQVAAGLRPQLNVRKMDNLYLGAKNPAFRGEPFAFGRGSRSERAVRLMNETANITGVKLDDYIDDILYDAHAGGPFFWVTSGGKRQITIDPSTFGKTRAGQLIVGAHELEHAIHYDELLLSFRGDRRKARFEFFIDAETHRYAIREVATELIAVERVRQHFGSLAPQQVAHSTRYIEEWIDEL